MEVTEFLARHGGIASRKHTIAATSRRKVAAALADHSVKLSNSRTLYLPETNIELVAAKTHHGQITCVTALAHYGVTVWNHDTSKIHIAVKAGYRRIHTENIVLHRESYSLSENLPFVPPIEAAMRAIRCVTSHYERVIMLDSILNRRLISPSALELAVSDLHDPKATLALNAANGRARSGLETIARLELESTGLSVEVGVFIDGVGEVDFLIEGVLIMEIDGYEFHSDRDAFQNDRNRTRAAFLRGYPTLRFTYKDVLTPGTIRKAVLTAFRKNPTLQRMKSHRAA